MRGIDWDIGNGLIVLKCYIVQFIQFKCRKTESLFDKAHSFGVQSKDIGHHKFIQLDQVMEMQIKEETPSELYLHTLNSNLNNQTMNIHLGDVRGVSISRPLEVSAFHLIVWVFAVKHDLQEEQHRRLRAMYGQSRDMIDPVTPSLGAFNKVMESIRSKNKRCVVKVVVDSNLKKKILETAKKDDQIIQVYHYKPKEQTQMSLTIDKFNTRSEFGTGMRNTSPFDVSRQKEEQIDKNAVRSEMLMRNRKLVGVFDDFDQIIERAERQVENFTKSYRTFENSHCLVGDFDKITRYRLRLIASIRLKVSDFDETLKAFKEFVFKTIPWLNAHLESMGQNGISPFSISNSIQRYQTAATCFLQAEAKQNQEKGLSKGDAENEQSEVQTLDPFEVLKDQFFHQMISIYQYEGLFYYILNSHLKLIGQHGASWKQLALPFSHMHRAIKHLYREGLKNEPQFYKQPFTVFRGGRARKSELQRYANAVANGGAFIEFFGFLSTSLSAKIVADKFVFSRYSRDGGADDEGADEEVVFLIKINPCSAILAEKYDYLVNGFFKLTSKQLYGESEREVIFNAMNVFRLTGISKRPLSQLFTEAERQQAAQKQAAAKNLPTFKYNQQKTRNIFYKKEITVVELQFGSFYETLLTQNKYDLSPAERAGKENYVHCMNRVNRFEKFDYGDACELTNEPQESYKYLKSKVGVTEQDLYLSSKVDNKNYFSRLSTVCQKLGKTKQAIGYSQIAINCYRQLEQVHHNEVFNAHYERLVDMQTRCIEILQQNSDFTSAQRKLRQQLLEIRSKSNADPKVKLLQSKVYINQAINYYSMGRLQECINRFAKCQRQLTKTIQQFSFDSEPLPFLFADFLAQIVCPNPSFGHRFCSYTAYIHALQQRNRKERERQLIQKHGSREQLEQTSRLAKDLQVIAKQAVQNRNALFKSRKKYAEFIARFNHQFQYNAYQSHACHQKSQRDEIQDKIIEKRRKLSSLDPKSNEYSQIFTQYNELIKKRSDIDCNTLSTQCSQKSHAIQQQDKKFKAKQRQRKIRELRDNILTENKHRLIEEYLKCTAQIDQAISQLKAEGYVESSLSILKMRVEKSKIYEECDERTAAMNEIQQIIRSGMVEGEYRYRELASAYSTKGKIHLEMKQVELAIGSIDEALQCFYKTVSSKREEQSMNDAVSAITERLQQVVAKQFNELQHNNDYLQTRILKLKALLIWVQIKRPRENGISRNIFGRKSNNCAWQQKHSSDHLLFVQSQISDIRTVLRSRSSLEDMSQLISDLLQVEICLHLISHRTQQRLGRSFECLKEYLQLCSNQEGKQNTKSALFCCELICRNSQNNDVLAKFIKMGYKDWLKSVQYNIINGPFAWKIQKCYFFLQRAQGRDNAARLHLEKAIQIIQAQLFNKHDSCLEEELNSLKWKLNERSAIILATEDNHDEMNDLQLPMQSVFIGGLKNRHRSNYSRYQTMREKADSTKISNASTISSLNNKLISIRPQQHQNPELTPQLSQFQVSSLTLRQFCKNIGKSRQPRRSREASYMNNE